MECLKLKTVQKCYIKALGTEEYAEKMGRKTIAGKKKIKSPFQHPTKKEMLSKDQKIDSRNWEDKLGSNYKKEVSPE